LIIVYWFVIGFRHRFRALPPPQKMSKVKS
jgi:hypothetical protein